MSYKLRPKAQEDITEIALYIASDNPRAAERWIETIHDLCRRLGAMPGIGSPRPDVAPGLRIQTAGRYLILYQETQGYADILRVIHGARDRENWL